MEGNFDPAEALVKRQFEKSKSTPGFDPAEALVSRSMGRGFIGNTPLSSVLTREMMGEQTDPASFSTMAQGGFVDDIKTRMKVYATRRFPSLSPEDALQRYGVHNGEIVYMDDDGKVKFEVPPKIGSRLKRFAGQEVFARTPSIALGAAGSLVGPLTAGAGAATGELIRKGIGRTVYGEPGSAHDIGVSAIEEGVGATIGERIGQGVVRLVDRSKGNLGNRLIKAAGRDITRLSAPEIQRVGASGRRFGINLTTPEVTRSPKLVDRFNLLADLPETSEKAMAAKTKRYAEVSDAVEKYLDTFAPATTTPGEAGRRGVEAAKGALKTEQNVRAGMAGPHYREAFESGARADIGPTVAFIDDELQTAKGEIRRHLENAKKLLMKPDLPEDAIEFETSLKGLHGAKMEIDDIIGNARQTGLGNTVKRNYTRIKQSLLQQMDEASPAYRTAREIFSDYSTIPEALQGTKLAKLAKLEGDAQEKAAYYLFSPAQSSPEAVNIARHYIVNEGGEEAWNALLRTYINTAFDKASKESMSGIGVSNIGGRLRSYLFGNRQQRKIIEAAMTTEQKAYFGNFMEVLERTGLLFGKESATATRQVALSRARAEGSLVEKGLEYAGSVDVTKPSSIVGAKLWIDRIRETLFAKRNERVLDAMLDQRGADQLRSMLKLTPRSRNLIRAFGVFTTQLGEGARSAAVDRTKQIDIPIPYTRPINDLPDPTTLKGATFQETDTGIVYRSDGTKWTPVEKPRLK